MLFSCIAIVDLVCGCGSQANHLLANVGRQRPRNEGTPDALASEVPECSGSLHDIVRIFGLFSMGVELGFRLLPVLAGGDPSDTSR
jgi:hypothetical protein